MPKPLSPGPKAKLKTKARIKAKPNTGGEAREHAALKLAVANLASACGFRVDTEIHFNLAGSRQDDGKLADERSADVAAYVEIDGHDCLLLFECKSGTDVKEMGKKASEWQGAIKQIREGAYAVISSDRSQMRRWGISALTAVRVCYVFGSSLPPKRFLELEAILRRNRFHAWNHETLAYYMRTVSAIGEAARYQLLRDFDVALGGAGTHEEAAVRFKQGNTEMFAMAMRPHDLLEIAYVYRRASGKPSAYQRILNRDRIEQITKWLKGSDPKLPNSIIIAFDPDASRHVKFNNGVLSFPRTYCSAWIIDGQHRVFGFHGTRWSAGNPTGKAGAFRIPVVAIKSISTVVQNRAFVSINANQKRMDSTLLCDLAASLPDLRDPLTWPSLLVKKLNLLEPLRDRVKIGELTAGRSISLSSFVRYALLDSLLAYDPQSNTYKGPLYRLSPLKSRASANSKATQHALAAQSGALQRFFVAVKTNTENRVGTRNPWINRKDYALLKPTGINALLLVLARILEKYPRLESSMKRDLDSYLKPLRGVRFGTKYVANKGGGWKGFRALANVMLASLNAGNSDSLRLYGEKEKV